MSGGYMLVAVSHNGEDIEMFYGETIFGLTKVVGDYYFFDVPVNVDLLFDMQSFFELMCKSNADTFAKNKYEVIELSKMTIKVLKVSENQDFEG